ncbi:hypothetical protein GOODEAATRI_032370 [Goodea atripinnis]|uniref:Uncharacterized protein n=1 Tax=Goodea atripinnis TaxID=208336 RepID=A0ABV0MWX4_9TELE
MCFFPNARPTGRLSKYCYSLLVVTSYQNNYFLPVQAAGSKGKRYYRVQQRLAGFLALDSSDLKKSVQLVLGCGDVLEDEQLLGVQDVQHVVEDRLQVTWV